ncbi:MAG TPA: TraR/DksA C4-type zinc finger protein, partial [Bacillota bacterium]
LRRLRDRLMAERDELERRDRRMTELGLDRSLSDSLGELSTYDNHPADIGDELFERSKDLGLRARVRRRIEAVDHALALMRVGQYGFCADCGRPIPAARLEAEPAAVRCARCQQRLDDAEGFARRPVEEEVLDRSLRRLFGDGAGRVSEDDSTAYDAEDAWQEVERYGTSSPPADDPDVTGFDEPFLHPDEAVGSVEAVEDIPAERRALAGEGDGDEEGGGGAGEG